MKIALVHMRHKGTGGTERHLNQTARHLAELGHAVTVVCRTHEEPPHPAVDFAKLGGGARGALGAASRMWAFALDAERHLRTVAYDVVYGLGRTWSQDVVRLGGGLVATHVEHAHAAAEGLAARVQLALSGKLRLARVIEARALGAEPAPSVLVNADLVRRDLLARYPAWRAPERRVHVVHNACDVARFDRERWREPAAALRRSLALDASTRVFLFLGTGYRRKGLAVLLRAFARHAAGDPAARLVVAGYESGAAHYERLAGTLGVAERVRFTGGRRDPEVAFAAADVYVLPTYYDPFAASTVEALSSGLPVVTTTTNGGAERVVDGLTGSIVPPGDVDALATALAFWSRAERIARARPVARAEACSFDERAAMETVTAHLLDAAERRAFDRPHARHEQARRNERG